MMAGFLSILPLLVVILVSLWTKQVLVGLGIGVILGAWLITPGIMPTLDTLLNPSFDFPVAVYPYDRRIMTKKGSRTRMTPFVFAIVVT